MKKRSIAIIIILSVLIFNLLGLTGCLLDVLLDIKINKPKNTYEEYGDFLYEVVYCDENGISGVTEEVAVRSAIRICGLSEAGMQKESVAIPEYIEGLKVEELGKSIEFLGTRGEWQENSILRKVYICHDVNINAVFSKCNNLECIIILRNYMDECYTYKPVYLTSHNYDSEKDIISAYINSYGDSHFANVSYFYNYENAPNDNYYWIDDYEYGEKIEFVPPVPTRDGYTFGGWYKESECINAWDFGEDTLPEVKYTDVIPYHQLRNDEKKNTDYRIYQETKLYAKWIAVGGAR